MQKDESKNIVSIDGVERLIHIVRNQKVILDQDLAVLYGVSTKRFNEQIRRNTDRFPEDFGFQITEEEWEILRSQIATSRSEWGGRRYKPFVFTEHGVVMAANVLKSKKAIDVSVEIVRSFIKMRQFLIHQKEIMKDLAEIKNYILKRFNKTDCEFKRIWNTIEKLSEKPKKDEGRKIGFKLD